jgi:hypothetical protein
MLIKGPAQQLADYMVKMCVKYHHSEWVMGLEFELWNEAIGYQDLLRPDEAAELMKLAEWCDGWVIMNYVAGKETLEFLPLTDWKIKFEKEKPF